MTRKAFPLSLDEVVGSAKKSRSLSKHTTQKVDSSATAELQVARQRAQRSNESGVAVAKKHLKKCEQQQKKQWAGGWSSSAHSLLAA